MSQIDVQNGARVEEGGVIGLSGGAVGTLGAGKSTGPHVDLMIRKDGVDGPDSASETNTINPIDKFIGEYIIDAQ